MAYVNIGEPSVQRASATFGPFLAVTNATRDKDYFEIYRAPSDRSVRVIKMSFLPNATQAAVATNYINITAAKIRSTTITTAGTVITTNTAGGWTAQTAIDMIVNGRDTLVLGPGDRLAVEIDNVGNGVITAGMSFHVELLLEN